MVVEGERAVRRICVTVRDGRALGWYSSKDSGVGVTLVRES
jgi:hypothetical protein